MSMHATLDILCRLSYALHVARVIEPKECLPRSLCSRLCFKTKRF